VDSSARWARLTRLVRSAVRDLFDQSQPFAARTRSQRLLDGHDIGDHLARGTLFFTISPEAAKGKVVLYLLLTITPFAVVAPASARFSTGQLCETRVHGVASVGSAVLVLLMAADIRGLLLFPERSASSCSRSSTWSPRRRWFRP